MNILGSRRDIYEEIGAPPAANPLPPEGLDLPPVPPPSAKLDTSAIKQKFFAKQSSEFTIQEPLNHPLKPSAQGGALAGAVKAQLSKDPAAPAAAAKPQPSKENKQPAVPQDDLTALIDFTKSPAYQAFDSPQSKTTKTENEGYSVIEQVTPNFQVRKVEKDATGKRETVRDRYGRLVYEKSGNLKGGWTARELKYQDKDGKRSPFLASMRSLSSDGILKTTTYGEFGLVVEERQEKLSPADLMRPAYDRAR